mmetsp:Transcript_22712/g.27861  ORF Transcript_22712/g.27861 Transcript_22712/m.27861 type:complete len:176 (-) Transcript_22712:869-1396(-)
MRSYFVLTLLLLVASSAYAFTSTTARSSGSKRRALIGSKSRFSSSLAATASGKAPKKVKKAKTVKKTKVAKAAAVADEQEEVVTFRKPEFISKIAEKTGMSKADSEAALSAVLETITEEVASGKRISMLGFGTFKLTHRKARKGRNPKTGEPIDINASNSPSFSAGKAFKERCNL